MKVIIVGCGPAGLAAAHAATALGAQVRILGPKVKTPQRGPLLIQRPIPGINTSHPDGTVHQVVIGGSITDYRYKLYGDVNIGINGNILEPSYHAWRHAETYDALWDLYADLIEGSMVTRDNMRSLHLDADLVVSTAPAKTLCWREPAHLFEAAAVLITPNCQYPEQPDNTIIFNAYPDIPWVRSSRIFGNEVTEWTLNARLDPEADGARVIWKPIYTDCNCYPHILRTGRFGAWRNETWVDTAYWDTYTAIEGMLRAGEIQGIY